MERLEQLAAQFRDADDVLLRLVASEERRGASTASRSCADDRGPVADAIDAGFRRVLRWRAGQHSPLGLVAREAVTAAVAAEALHDRFPAVAAELRRPWMTAVRVRGMLLRLGPEAEQVALRLLPSWRASLDELPAVAGALTGTSSMAVAVMRDQAAVT